jgi:hypothetical protein
MGIPIPLAILFIVGAVALVYILVISVPGFIGRHRR